MKKKKIASGTPEEENGGKNQKRAVLRELRSFFVRLFLLCVVGLLFFKVIFGIRPMKNDDMAPRISAGDLVLFFRLEDTIYNNDVIVFKKADNWYVARVVAHGGDSVEITEDAALKINGHIVIESNIYYTTPQYVSEVTYPVQLKDDEYFVLCDYREGGKDSRYFGPVQTDEIKGKVMTVIRRSGL